MFLSLSPVSLFISPSPPTCRKKAAPKKKEKGGHGGDEEEDLPSSSSSDPTLVPFMSLEEMKKFVREQFPDTKENAEFVSSVCQHIHKPLTREFQEVVRSVFLSSSEGKDKRKENEELQEQFS